jgi:hypothetical protein
MSGGELHRWDLDHRNQSEKGFAPNLAVSGTRSGDSMGPWVNVGYMHFFLGFWKGNELEMCWFSEIDSDLTRNMFAI